MPEPEPRVAPWEDFVLRLIAVYKFIKAALFFSIGLGLMQLLHRDVNKFLNDYVLEYRIDPENRFLHKMLVWALDHASTLTDHKIRLISYIIFFYAAIFLIEGLGLYLRKHWAEYMVLLSTGLLLPIEFMEIYRKAALWKYGVMLGNLLIVAYLIHRIRLDAKFKAEQRRLREVETASSSVPVAPTDKTVVNEVQ